MQERYPGFLHFFFVYQHFERFTAGGFNNPQPWWFYPVVLFGLTLPWSLWLVRARLPARTTDSIDGRAWRTLMWIWLAVIVGFFSLPQSKPVGYVMPALFPLAFLIAEPALAAWHSRRTAAAPRRCRQPRRDRRDLSRSPSAWRRHATTATTPRSPTRCATHGHPVIRLCSSRSTSSTSRCTHNCATPVPVIADWHAPDIFTRDNWRRELAEAAPFAPERAAALLVDARQGFRLRCGKAPLWAVVKNGDVPIVAALPGALRVAATHHAELWRIAPQACTSAESAPK